MRSARRVGPQLIRYKPASVAAPVFSISYNAKAPDNVQHTTYSFSGISFGTVASGRDIIIGVASYFNSNTFDFSSATIDGVSATLIAKATNAGGLSGAAFYYLPSGSDPGNASGTVTVTHSTQITQCTIGCWSVYNRGSSFVSATLDDAASHTVMAGTVTIPAGGVSMGIVMAHSATSSTDTPSGFNQDFFDTTGEATGAHSGVGVLTGSQALTFTLNTSAFLPAGVWIAAGP